jgi:hypothetical protein
VFGQLTLGEMREPPAVPLAECANSTFLVWTHHRRPARFQMVINPPGKQCGLHAGGLTEAEIRRIFEAELNSVRQIAE